MWFQGVLLAFIGDTPANNKVGGYKESVSKCYRKCRQCLSTKLMMQFNLLSIYVTGFEKTRHMG